MADRILAKIYYADWPDGAPNSIKSESIAMQALLPWIGGLAAVLTSLSYIPQVQKAWPRGSTQDISLKMLAILTAGLILWIGYGVLREDWVIILANGVGAALSGTVLYCKLRDINRS